MAIFMTKKNTFRCPICEGYYDKRDFKENEQKVCCWCQCDLISEYEYDKRPLVYEPKSNIICPYCNSNNTSKISTLGRAVSTVAFGVASSKIGK